MNLTKDKKTIKTNKVKEFIDTLNNLNPQEIHKWPFSIITFLGVMLSIFVLFMGYFLVISSSIDDLNLEISKEEKLKKDYSDKIKQAVNLNGYKRQLQEITIASDQLLKQLPDSSEIENLLISINQAGGTRGLKFEYFKPEKEIISEFYAELPIKIKVTGTYDAIGNFATDISQLSRVVVLKEISLTSNNGLISMEATAKTFRYLDASELEKKRLEKKKDKDKNKAQAPEKEKNGHSA